MSALNCRTLSRVLRPLGALILLLLPVQALAHGGGTPQVTDVAAGPYRLFVWTSPEPWRADELAHVTVAVTQIGDNDETFPITDAQITVRLIPDDQPAQVVTLNATPVSAVAAGFFETDHVLPTEGLWQVEVDVKGSDGAGAVSFTMTAQPATSASNWLVWAGGALALLAAGVFLGTRRRSGSAKAPVHSAAESAVAQE
jgi:LPXTG-motif cell wall-anchored protein